MASRMALKGVHTLAPVEPVTLPGKRDREDALRSWTLRLGSVLDDLGRTNLSTGAFKAESFLQRAAEEGAKRERPWCLAAGSEPQRAMHKDWRGLWSLQPARKWTSVLHPQDQARRHLKELGGTFSPEPPELTP